jgi:hypothetical protein
MEDSQVLDERNDAIEIILARMEKNADEIQKRAEELFKPKETKPKVMPETKPVVPPKVQLSDLTPEKLLRQRPHGTWEPNPDTCKAATLAIREALKQE